MRASLLLVFPHVKCHESVREIRKPIFTEKLKKLRISQWNCYVRVLEFLHHVLLLQQIHHLHESDVDYLVTALKQKLSLTTGKQQQIKLLTLAPQSWTIAKTIDEFGFGKRLVRRARELRKEHGILPEVTHRKTFEH